MMIFQLHEQSEALAGADENEPIMLPAFNLRGHIGQIRQGSAAGTNEAGRNESFPQRGFLHCNNNASRARNAVRELGPKSVSHKRTDLTREDAL